MTRLAILFASLIVVSSFAYAGSLRQNILCLKGVAVQGVSRPSVYSGVIESYVEFDVTKNGESILLYYPYFESEIVLPNIGSLCDFQYEEREVNGQAGGRFLKSQEVKVVKTFDCK